MINIWNIGKSLTTKEYDNIYKLIDVAFAAAPADIKPAIEFLKIVQKELTVYHIQDAYTTIHKDTAKKMLGESNASALLQKHGFTVRGDYFIPGPKPKSEQVFEVTDERIAKISEIVQFLE